MIFFSCDGTGYHQGGPLDIARFIEVKFGQDVLFLDRDISKKYNKLFEQFDFKFHGIVGIGEGTNILRVINILSNVMKNHKFIYGTFCKSVYDEKFMIPLPSYGSMFSYISWSDLDTDESLCSHKCRESNTQMLRDTLTPVEFFKMFPLSGCPNTHAYDDDTDDIESTCTLCEEFLRSRSRSPRACSQTQIVDIFHCVECGVHMGNNNPRQLCGKTCCFSY